MNEDQLAKEIIQSEQDIQNETVHTEMGPRPLELMLSAPFDCIQCGKRCGTRRSLVNHLRSHPGIQTKSEEIDNLVLELRTEAENKPEYGDESENENQVQGSRTKRKKITVKTEKGITAEAEVKVKVKRQKRDPNEPNQCEYCTKEFNSPRKLAIHIRVHTKERPYVCLTFNKGFSDPKGLQVGFMLS